MLLIDGVKYQEWTDLKETEDLEPMVIKFAKNIFGEPSEYFDIKRQLEACLGRRTIPDGYVVDFGKPPKWHIVEVELSSHPVDKHIREQINDFITAAAKVVSPNRHKIIDEIYGKIRSDTLLRYKIDKLVEPKEIYEFLTNLILYESPILTIVIERKTDALVEDLRASLRYSPMNVVEFRTFRREGAESIHAHLFEPLNVLPPPHRPPVLPPREGRKRVTASDFTHKGNGIFAFEADPSVVLDLKKRIALVSEQLSKYGLESANLGSFYWYLRKKVGLLNTPTED